jgi:uncharacterized protein YhbP (UPF0306 family)
VARVSTEATPTDIPPHVLDFIGEMRTFTVATASPGGVPRAGTFLYVNEGGRLYFWTKPHTTTARHIEQNPAVSFTIDEYSEDLQKTRGVQGSGECSVVLSGVEIARAADLFGQKFPDLAPGATMSISFFRVVPKEIQFIDNTAAPGERQEGVFGAEFHTERAYSVFADLPTARLESIAAPMGKIAAEAGEVIVRRGGPADKFFIVADGEVEVIEDESGSPVTLGPGHFFGETAVMLDRPRSATVRATRPTTLFSMDRDTFRDLVAQSLGIAGEFDKVIQGRLSAMAGEA